MEKARREGISGSAATGGLDIDVAALVAHTKPLGADELVEMWDGDRDVLDAAEEAGSHSAVCEALSRAMGAVEKQIQPLVEPEVWRLVVRRCDLGGDAELVTGAERLTLGLVLGAAWQYRATLRALHEWLIGGPPPDPGRHAPVDHQAALSAAYQAADEAYERVLGELEGTG